MDTGDDAAATPGDPDVGESGAPGPSAEDAGMDPTPETVPLYGTIPRRIQAVLIDGTFLLVLLIAVSSLSTRLDPASARWLNRALLAAILLYEPLLVSLRGGTLGHRLLNLRVVADEGGRVSFPRALLRSLTKALLGWVSFIFMSFTRRYQALHDLVARATVQLRDPSRASEAHFVPERHAPEAERRVHLVRRLLVAFGYFMLATLLLDAVKVMAVSRNCFDYRACIPRELAVLRVVDVATLVVFITLLVLGWQGKLPGARSRRVDTAEGEPAPAS
jgi:uncharacterized RDD family membrane protein YckC